MFVDPLGRLLGETGLYTRTVLTAELPVYTIPTLYRRFGDWFVGVCCMVAFLGVVFGLVRKRPGVGTPG
jgi:apolipoprotein N-acyltransferase